MLLVMRYGGGSEDETEDDDTTARSADGAAKVRYVSKPFKSSDKARIELN